MKRNKSDVHLRWRTRYYFVNLNNSDFFTVKLRNDFDLKSSNQYPLHFSSINKLIPKTICFCLSLFIRIKTRMSSNSNCFAYCVVLFLRMKYSTVFSFQVIISVHPRRTLYWEWSWLLVNYVALTGLNGINQVPFIGSRHFFVAYFRLMLVSAYCRRALRFCLSMSWNIWLPLIEVRLLEGDEWKRKMAARRSRQRKC